MEGRVSGGLNFTSRATSGTSRSPFSSASPPEMTLCFDRMVFEWYNNISVVKLAVLPLDAQQH
jgi:hypothetical protein